MAPWSQEMPKRGNKLACMGACEITMGIQMTSKAVTMFVVGVCITAWGCGVTTQQAEAQFRIVEEISIAPGTVEEFEAASKDRTARMVAGDVTFGRLVSVTNDNVYRFVTLLGEDFSSVGEWREQIAAMPAGSTPDRAAGIIDHIDRAIWQSQPDISHEPESPRLENDEIGFVHVIRLYPKFGAIGDVVEVLQRITALNVSSNLNSRRLVAELVAGPETPALSITWVARDREDYYAQYAQDGEAMGEEFQELVNQLLRLCRKFERQDYTARQDLGYQPSN